MYRIYMITGPNGKQYIGKTKATIYFRWRKHIEAAKAGSKTAIACSIRKHGHLKFTIVELTQCVDEREAIACERGLIAQYGTYVTSGNGYNLTSGGEGTEGHRHSAEARARMSQFQRGRKLTPEALANIRAASVARKGSKDSPEVRARKSAAQIKRGRRPEERERFRQLGLAKKGKPIPPEVVEKIRAGNLGKKMSPEAIEKIRLSNIGRKRSPETIARMVEAKKDNVYPEEIKVVWRANIKKASESRTPETFEKIWRAANKTKQEKSLADPAYAQARKDQSRIASAYAHEKKRWPPALQAALREIAKELNHA